MQPRTLHTLELSVAIIGQTLILIFGWAFLGSVFVYNPLIIPDYFAHLVRSKQAETTWVITLIATALAIATTTFLAIAFKEALRHRMHRSISLVQLNSGIALARGSFLINLRHLIPTSITLVVFGLTRLLVSSWATLLTPTPVTWAVDASGWELDLTSSSFESLIQNELVQSGAALVRGNSSEIIDIGGVLSGIAAAQYSFGTPGVFAFNGVKYNISTGGVLPAAPSYGGATQQVSNDNTGLAFAGGFVPVHLDVHFPKGQGIQGLSHNYTLLQQGLTANVTCREADTSLDYLNFSSTFYPMPVPLADGTIDYWLWAWNITADCTEGRPSQQQYVTRSNSSSAPQGYSSGMISTFVCPYPLRQSGFSWQHFTLFTNASWKYDFLPLTVCTINPLVTTSLVRYSGGIVNATVIQSQPLGNGNTNLTQFLAAIVDYQSRTTQGLTTNSIGDSLYSIYVSASSNNETTAQDVTDVLLSELEQYWRGVIEFSGTFLKSAFSVHPRTIPDDARVSVSGYESITTMGWYRRSETYGYTIIPITIVALMMYAAVAYTLWHVLVERGHESFTTFDPSNPIHVMMVSSARDATERDNKDHLEDWLAGFERGGVAENENLRVRLFNVGTHRKRFGVTSD